MFHVNLTRMCFLLLLDGILYLCLLGPLGLKNEVEINVSLLIFCPSVAENEVFEALYHYCITVFSLLNLLIFALYIKYSNVECEYIYL